MNRSVFWARVTQGSHVVTGQRQAKTVHACTKPVVGCKSTANFLVASPLLSTVQLDGIMVIGVKSTGVEVAARTPVLPSWPIEPGMVNPTFSQVRTSQRPLIDVARSVSRKAYYWPLSDIFTSELT